MAHSAKNTQISLVLWHFTLEDEPSDASAGPSSSNCDDRLLPAGFELRLHGTSTKDGSLISLLVQAVISPRVLSVVPTDSANYCQCSLIGALNRAAALNAGFSADLVFEFQHGFPTLNWQSLLRSHIEMILTGRRASMAEADEISLVWWRIAFKSIKIPGIFRDFGIFLYGIRTDTGDQWESSAVIEVLGTDLVRTDTRTYRLVGPLNRKAFIQSGMAIELADAFANGFPKNWRLLVEDYVDYMKRVFCKQMLEQLPDEEWEHEKDAHSSKKRCSFVKKGSPSDELQSDPARQSEEKILPPKRRKKGNINMQPSMPSRLQPKRAAKKYGS